MAMRRAVLAGLLMLMTGCGGDPTTSRLEPGQAVLVHAPAPLTEVPARVYVRLKPPRWSASTLDVGQRALVIEDPPGGPLRPVRVSTSLLGDLTEVRRDRLRPVR